jgi:hypothetical protein
MSEEQRKPLIDRIKDDQRREVMATQLLSAMIQVDSDATLQELIAGSVLLADKLIEALDARKGGQ